MARIPDRFIDELLGRIDIVEVVESRVPLKRAGREYQARCPFHDERSPSFTVSPTKQFYHCFGCGAHGTAIRFLMEYDRLGFRDAVEELARRAGVEVPYEGGPAPDRDDDRNDVLYATLEAARHWFGQQFAASDKARAYAQRRGLDDAAIERFGIGYAPEAWDALKSALAVDPAREQLLLEVGLLSRSDSGRVYDKFRDRLVIPIHDRRGRTIAFGGRLLGGGDGPKYLNSPESALFHKGRELYALDLVRAAHAKILRLIVVEGYMDVIALFQHGFEHAVATLGTATTREHAELLFRNAPDVYFCFDGDRAGRQAAWRAVESVLPRMRDGRQAFFLFLPEGEDPDSLVRSEGHEGLERRIGQATPLSQFFFDELARDADLGTLDGRARLAERARPMIASIPDGAFRDLMAERLHEHTGVGLAGGAAMPGPATPAQPRRGAPPRRSLVRAGIELLLQQPQLAADAADPLPFAALDQPGVPLLIELIDLARARPGITTGALLEHFADRDEAPALQKLAAQSQPGDGAGWQQAWYDTLAKLEVQTVAQRERQLLDRFATLSAEEKRELVAIQRQLRA
ncbi:MAG TPA: DNA primase [Xanthomonadaceae bacterium]|nr:DNA primase [Xanthomonadaceae bacterium]